MSSGIYKQKDSSDFLGKNYNVSGVAWFNSEDLALRVYTESRNTNNVNTAATYCSSRGLRLPTYSESCNIKNSVLYSSRDYWTSTVKVYYYGPNHYRYLFNRNNCGLNGPTGDDQGLYTHDIICIKN